MVVFVFFLSSIVLAHPEHEFASVTYRGSSEVTHEGDYVDFTINLSASCYVEQQDARNRVIDSLSIFKKWLDEIPEVNYIINLINISESNRNYNSSCDGGYSASQEIKVTLNKRADDKALDKNTLEKFFNDLQTVIGPMNFFEHRQRQARFEIRITAIAKGVYEETIDYLTLAAKAKAQQKATREFLAFLGSDYKGQWHLHAAEFNDFNANYVYIDLPFIAGSQVGNIPLPPPGPTNDNLSTIELRAIKLHIEANFVFYFLPTNHISL
jgi:hypothetical protein